MLTRFYYAVLAQRKSSRLLTDRSQVQSLQAAPHSCGDINAKK